MEGLKTGIKYEKIITVKKEYLANEVRSGDVPVFSTPMVICAMESAASELLKKHLEHGVVSVGTKINIDHIAPTVENIEVKVKVKLVSIEGKKYKFYVEAYDNAGLIAKGEHVRVALNKEKFLQKSEERSKIIV